MLVELEDITCLLGAGAEIICLNQPSFGDLLQEVRYGEHEFIAASKESYAPEIY